MVTVVPAKYNPVDSGKVYTVNVPPVTGTKS